MTEPESAERPDDLAPVPRYRWVSPGRLLWLGLAAVAGLTLALNFGELRSIAGTARRAEWEWLVATAGVEVLFVINLALFYSSTFRASGIPTHPARFVLLTSASHFVNLVSKTGGLGGVALYLREGERSAVSSARISAAYMVAYVLGYLAYVSVLVLALVLLYVRGNLNRAEVVAAAIILGIVFTIAGVMVFGLRSEASLERMLRALARPVNAVWRRLHARPLMNAEALKEIAHELYDAASGIRHRPRSYMMPLAHGLTVELLSAMMLFTVARSLHAEIGAEQALAGYAIALLFSMVAITPAGLGVVEVSLSALLVSFGVPRHHAIATALGYRFFEFWLPLLLGAISLHLLRDRVEKQSAR